MLNSHVRANNKDINVIIKDAQALFQDAAALTGDKAIEVRQRASRLLDTALVTAHDAQASAMVAGKEMAASADHYVKENPWKTISAAASLGLLLGVILGRK
jgi:ElaB/YqjD/DUF883 family membrane-anchored ribosome-binding protein